MKTAMSASKSLEKMIAKKRQLSPVAIKPVSDACLLFFRSLVLLAELTSLTTKSSNFFPEARTCHRNMPPILYRREINKNDKKKFTFLIISASSFFVDRSLQQQIKILCEFA